MWQNKNKVIHTERSILVINQYASTPSYSSGAGERHFFLAAHLIKRHIYSNIVAGSYNHLFINYPITKKLFTQEQIKGGRIIWVKQLRYKNKYSKIGRVFSWFDFLFKLFLFSDLSTKKPDIIIVSSMSLWPMLYARWLKKRLKIPLILEVRDLWPLTIIQEGNYSRFNPFILAFGIFEKLSYRYADSIISLLPNFSKHLSTLLPNLNKKVWYIPNAIEPDFTYINEEKTNIRPSHNFTIAYTGAIGIANAMDCFVESAVLLKDYPNIMFLIVGDGSEKDKLVTKANGLSNIEFKPKIQKGAVLQLLSQVDACFISWQNYEMYNYGVSANKYNDYMLAAKPIISASNIPDDPVVMANCGIQVESGNSHAIADAILKLFYMRKTEREALGKNGYNYVLQNNTYEVIAKKYEACINEVLSTKMQP